MRLGVVPAAALAAVVVIGGGVPATADVTPVTTPPVEARDLSRSFAAAARAIGPAVVRIEVEVDAAFDPAPDAPGEEGQQGEGGDGDREGYRAPGTAALWQVARRGKGAAGTASGVVLDTRGHVITAGHVVAGAREIRVVFPSGISRRGRVLGRDPQTDMALIKIERPPRGLTAARLGDSRDVTVGDWVLAVGSPLGLDQTITVGIVSALARNPASDEVVAHRVRRFIETDAKINPGSSGGPLVSLSGEVVGINTLINAGPGGSYGFAVPVNEARRVAQALLAEGRVRYAYLGVALRDVSDLDAEERRRTAPGLGLRGAVVSRVLDGAPASRAGLEPGDVITSIDNQEMAAADDIVDYVADRVVGTQVTVGYVRRGTCGVARLRLDELPREHAAE